MFLQFSGKQADDQNNTLPFADSDPEDNGDVTSAENKYDPALTASWYVVDPSTPERFVC